MVFGNHFLGSCFSPVCAKHRTHYSLRKPERGVFAIMIAVLLVIILGFCGMALGLGQIYNRKVELQGMANAAALAAARELDGTAGGITAALDQAAVTAARFNYDYNKSVTWTNDAIRFSSSPLTNADWVSGTDGTPPAKLFYVKVDTSKLDATVGAVSPAFIEFLSSLTSVQVSDRAVAGRTAIKVTPLAICALASPPGTARGTELVEYGFRRGVGYDLMRLNPGDDTAENFVIDPTVAPGEPSSSHHTSASAVGPFVCTGTMWMPRVTGGAIQVSRPFPIASLYKQLNSRFDEYVDNLCSPNGAPPDFNVRPFNSGAGSWMSPIQDKPVAAPAPVPNKSLRTIADPDLLPPGTTTKMWGTLWSYAKAVKYASYQAGKSEPAAGYSTFGTTDFPGLYQTGLGASGYPTGLQGGTPYRSFVTSPPNHKKLAEDYRRVLNVPLLSCPVPSGSDVSASVLAIGKFFMTVPATSDSISAEFGGIVPEQSLAGRVELFP